MFVEAVTRLHRALETVQPESPEALLQPGGDPDPACPHRPGPPLLRPRGTRQPSRHGGGNPDGETPPRYEQADASGEPSDLMEWTEFHEQVEALPEEEREVFNLVWYEQ